MTESKFSLIFAKNVLIMSMKIAINGFGRIGRLAFRILKDRHRANHMVDVDVVAINDLADVHTLAYLLKYDTAQGRYQGSVEVDKDKLIVDGNPVDIFSEKDPSQLPWQTYDIDLVLEATGALTKKEDASKHLDAGARKVVISAPPKGDIPSVVLGVNDSILKQDDSIISNASCTTNCLAPMVKVLDDQWGITSGMMTTAHAYTADQNIQDAPHKKLRRGRAAAENIVPTSTGAAKAIGEVMPHLAGKLDGYALRVPVLAGSITDLTCQLKEEVSPDAINKLFRDASQNGLKGYLEYCDDEIVSSDIINNEHSCIFDADSTRVIGNTVKVVGWYDNEAGYSARLIDLMVKIKEYSSSKVAG